ncbi:MAG TPA: DUF4097 family beta strand repeat-containing protein [Blastocatellia bacterium]|nr:DUF4097 family beta strand repeat-containing protein [Blastocatellia bacterium]
MSYRLSLLPVVVLTILLSVGAITAEPYLGFEKTYSPQGPANLTISNIHGDINVTVWNRKTINVRAIAPTSVPIQDQVSGNDISVSVKKSLRVGKATFEVSLPSETSLQLHNIMGRVQVQGVSGHITVKSFDGDVRLINVRAQSVDVNVTTGNIFFDGDLLGSGSFSLQSVKGDIDITLPGSTSFNLVARALNENINLGDFASSLSGANRGVKGLTGTYLRGGPRLSLTTFNGRILLRRK